MATALRLSLFLSFTGFLPVSASAQIGGGGPEPYPCLSFEPDHSIEWPSDPAYGSPPDFRRLVVADLDGDQTPDGVVSSGGIAVALWGLVAYDAVQLVEFPAQPAPAAVADLAALPGGGDGGRDAVLMTDWRGLFRVTHDGTAFEDPEPIAAGGWIDAAPIHVAYLDADVFPDVFGITADRRKIVTCFGTGSGFDPGPTIVQSLVLHDVVAMDWDHAPLEHELVALSARGLRVHSSSTGALLASVSHLQAPGCITRFDQSDGTERLAWTRGTSSGESELVVLGGQGAIPAGPWPLSFWLCETYSGITPTALLAGDYDDDGNEDLLLAHQLNQTALVLMNLGGYPYFAVDAPAEFDVLPLSAAAAAPGGVGIPAFAHIDDVVGPLGGGDNPEDIAFPVSATARVEVFTSVATQKQIVGGSIPDSADVYADSMQYEPGSNGDGVLRVAFNRLPRYADYEYLHLAVWREESPGATIPPGAVPHSHTGHLLLAPDVLVQRIPSWAGFPSDACWGDDPETAPCFYAEVRFVDGDDEDNRSRPFPAGFRLESCEPGADNYSYMEDQIIPGADPLDVEQHMPDPAGEAKLIGIYVPMSALPPMENGSAPVRGPLEEGGRAEAP